MYNLKEYARLSMMIKRHREKGLDVSQLLAERKKITKVDVTNNVTNNKNNMLLITNNNDNNNVTNNDSKDFNNMLSNVTNNKNNINLETLQVNISELINSSLLSFKEELISLIDTKLSNLSLSQSVNKEVLIPIKKESKTVEQSSLLEIKKETISQPKKSPSQPKKKIVYPGDEEGKLTDKGLFLDKELYQKITDFQKVNKEKFPSITDFIKLAFVAYEQKEITLEENDTSFS